MENRILRGTELVASLDRRHISICAEQRERLREIAELDNLEWWKRDGCQDMATWVAGRYSISKWEAHRWVRAAHALEELPLTSEALSTGRLSPQKIVELTRFATAATEKELISWAARVSPRAIRRRADRENRPDPEDARDAERERYVRWWFEDHSMGLDGRFPAVQGAAIAKAISRLADQLPDLPDDDLPDDLVILDEDKVGQRRADALYLIASAHSDKDSDVDRATVVVHRRLPDPDCDGWAELERGPVLDPEVERRICCDARLQFVLTDADGNALGVGRTSRNVPLGLERLVRHRDGCECTFSGCGMATFLESHHIWHWEDGGGHELPNLVTVCHFHHKLVHEFGWRVALNGTMAEWYRPSGARFEPGPDPPEQLSIGA